MKLIDDNLLECIPEIPSRLIEPILFIRKVESVKSDGSVGHRIFLATNYGIYLYKSKFYKKKVDFDKLIPWGDLKEVSQKDNNDIFFKFPSGTFRWRDPQQDTLLEVILQTLVNIFAPQELPKISVKQDIPSPDTDDKVIPQVKRLLYKCRENNVEPTKKFLNDYLVATKKFIKHNDPVYDLGQIPNYEDFSDVIFETFEIIPKLENLSVPKTKYEDTWNDLATLLRKNIIIKSLIFHDHKLDGIKKITQALSQNSLSKVVSISFHDATISERSLKIITDLLTQVGIRGMGFVNCEEKNVSLSQVLESESVFNSLIKLQISKIKNLSPGKAIFRLPNLMQLDFSNNDVDISPTLEALCSMKSTKMRHIVCNGNFCEKPLSSKCKFPKRFQMLIANNITWSDRTMESITHAISQANVSSDATISVDFSQAKIQDEYLKHFFKHVKKQSIGHLKTFKWSCNPLHRYLFNFLSRSPKLDHLIIGGCFEPNDQTVDDFLDFIDENNTITKLTFQGVEDKVIDIDTLEFIFQNVVTKKIKYFDIRDNNLKDDAYIVLTDFLKKNTDCEGILLDGNKPHKYQNFEDFIEFLLNRKLSIWVEFPRNDMIAISKKTKKKAKPLTIPMMRQMQQKLKVIMNFKISKPVVVKKARPKQETTSYVITDDVSDEESDILAGYYSDDDDMMSDQINLDEEDVSPQPEPQQIIVPALQPSEFNFDCDDFTSLTFSYSSLSAVKWENTEELFLNDSQYFNNYHTHVMSYDKDSKIQSSFNNDFNLDSLAKKLVTI
ncbi:hypothetical protein TVAG_494440 [Trichomonas vaginalis G3]|uniref:Leucine Rich Repeat family protein n=1 Tax=Trichomonas vaginalis (strain ATCC PRA-98 / G3) TaxID=412133 RepID=A2DQ75_TRIV3|nr:leucine-rich repeat, isoform f-related family [Trichomonas vaginalis G3]EAY17502.1 hypothetical protein TVAG_494440 [Trichomonas vaginalis G3]KAI5533607.1 leucine-rich repeat, isoform f-related family [Trichomonas vaginalis G3]|eukprot:XP_001329637.1 hypothetical protein [Trichomonas vaginalis G3]